jgi:hypothetical protein
LELFAFGTLLLKPTNSTYFDMYHTQSRAGDTGLYVTIAGDDNHNVKGYQIAVPWRDVMPFLCWDGWQDDPPYPGKRGKSESFP